MSKNFYQYLAESRKSYKYRLRTVVELNDDSLKIIENVLDNYDPISISEITKTILQEAPLDFPNFSMVEVYILDIVTAVPVSDYILQEKLRAALNIPESAMNLRMFNDPTELETMRLDDYSNWDDVKEPMLSTDVNYHEYNYDADKEPAYGDEYNKKFLAYLAAVKRDRAEVDATVQPENEVKGMFTWMKNSDEAENFNDEYDTVQPVYQSEIGDKEIPEPLEVANDGNFDSISRIDAKKVIKK